MRIQTECISFENCWTISSSYDFQAHQHQSQRRCFSQTALQWFNVFPGPPRCTGRPLHQSSELFERFVCNATQRLGNGKHVVLSQKVQGWDGAVWAVQYTRVFVTETCVVADESLYHIIWQNSQLFRKIIVFQLHQLRWFHSFVPHLR